MVDSEEEGTTFCPRCGAAAQAGDVFCRRCGTRLDAEIAEDSLAAAAPLTRRSRRRSTLLALAALLLLALFAGAAAVVYWTSRADDEPTAAELALVRQEERERRLRPPFTRAMEGRDRLFLLERQYLAAMKDAQERISKYRKRLNDYNAEVKQIDNSVAAQRQACQQYYDVPCPDVTYPNYPEAPDVSTSTRTLRSAANRLNDFRADLVSLTPPGDLRVFYAQMGAAVESLRADANHNADVLTEATGVQSEGEGGGGLNFTEIAKLRGESALSAIKRLNREAIRLIKDLRLQLRSFDVRGGRDVDPGDHSFTI